MIIKHNMLLYTLLFAASSLFAQKKIEYITPPGVQSAKYSIDFEDIVAEEDYCKFRLVINNKTDQYMAFDLSKVGFDYGEMGTYYPKKGKVKVIPPNDRILETIKIDGNMNYIVDNFSLKLEGFQFVLNEPETISDEAPLVEKTKKTFGNFSYEVKKAYQKRGKFTFAYNITYNGPKTEFGVLDQNLFVLKSAAGESHTPRLLPKKAKVIQKGKKLMITGDFETEESDFSIAWNGTLKNYVLVGQELNPVKIRRFAVASANTQPTRTTTTVNTCPAAFGRTTGKSKVNFYNAEHSCFKLYVNGALINNDFSSNVTFNTGPGKKMLEFRFQNGHVLNDNLLINSDWLEVAYRVKPKGNSYSVNMNVASVVREEKEPTTVVIERNYTYNSNSNSSNNNSSSNNNTSSRSNSSGCSPSDVTYGQFSNIKEQINDEITDFNKIGTAKNLVSGRCLKASQVAELAKLFMMDDKRLEFAKHAYRYTYDPNNYYLVVNTLTFDMKKDELREYTRSN